MKNNIQLHALRPNDKLTPRLLRLLSCLDGYCHPANAGQFFEKNLRDFANVFFVFSIVIDNVYVFRTCC